MPLSRTRAERFDDLVRGAVERLETRWADALRDVEFAVEEVPPAAQLQSGADPVPLARSSARTTEHPARVVVYRRPIETRADGYAELTALVHDVVVDQVADLLGLEPEQVDPSYRPDDPE